MDSDGNFVIEPVVFQWGSRWWYAGMRLKAQAYRAYLPTLGILSASIPAGIP